MSVGKLFGWLVFIVVIGYGLSRNVGGTGDGGRILTAWAYELAEPASLFSKIFGILSLSLSIGSGTLRQAMIATRPPITIINDQGKEEIVAVGPIDGDDLVRIYFLGILSWLFVGATSIWGALVVATFFSTSRFLGVFIVLICLRWGLSALLSIPCVKRIKNDYKRAKEASKAQMIAQF
jgi:hypothetical protein